MQIELVRILLSLAHELVVVLPDQIAVHVRRHTGLEPALSTRERVATGYEAYS